MVVCGETIETGERLMESAQKPFTEKFNLAIKSLVGV
jgi:hypothetical protein